MTNDTYSSLWSPIRCRSYGAHRNFWGGSYKDLAPTKHLLPQPSFKLPQTENKKSRPSEEALGLGNVQTLAGAASGSPSAFAPFCYGLTNDRRFGGQAIVRAIHSEIELIDILFGEDLGRSQKNLAPIDHFHLPQLPGIELGRTWL
jgi:hypothetical protein